MKNIILGLLLLSSTLSAPCQTPSEKTHAAKVKLENARHNLKQAREELNATYPAYKQEAKELITANDKKIEELRNGFVMPKRSPLNDERKKQIDSLENINVELRDRLYIVNE